MVKLLKDKFGIEVSESTIRRALQEHEYHYIGTIIWQKNTWKEQQKRLDWCRRHLDKYWHKIFFTDETTVYVENPSGYKWVKKSEKYIENKKQKERTEAWSLGSNFSKWKNNSSNIWRKP